jgi:polyisoprenoid-binding protein YceI
MRAFVAMLLLAGAGAGAAAPLIETSTTPRPGRRWRPSIRTPVRIRAVTRWGQEFTGRFPQVQGDIVALPDGRRQVRITLADRGRGNRRPPALHAVCRGPRFFDVARFPDVQFVSEPTRCNC